MAPLAKASCKSPRSLFKTEVEVALAHARLLTTGVVRTESRAVLSTLADLSASSAALAVATTSGLVCTTGVLARGEARKMLVLSESSTLIEGERR